jgi:hypothetical protein
MIVRTRFAALLGVGALLLLVQGTSAAAASAGSGVLLGSSGGRTSTTTHNGHAVHIKTSAMGAPSVQTEGSAVRGTPAAPASPSCYRSSCNGKDPVPTGCSATTSTASYRDYLWDSYSKTYLQVWSRWSSSCQTNWPRVAFSGDYGAGVDAFMQYGTGAPQVMRWDFQATIFQATANLVWGNMLDGGAGTQCLTAWGTIGGYIGEADPSGCA